MGGDFSPTTTQNTFGSAQLTSDSRVRIGNNYTIQVDYQTTYKAATVTIGNLAAGKLALPLNKGLDAPNFVLTGPNSSDFETASYSEDNPPTKGQMVITDADHSSTAYPGFDVTITVPTNNTMNGSTFEYIHSIHQFLTTYILDNESPVINNITQEPSNNRIDYNNYLWIGVNATDAENTKLPTAYDGKIYRCYFNISGPGYSQAFTSDTDCKRTFTNLVNDGTYTVNVYAVDSTGNIGATETRNYSINLIPTYINNSFNITRQFYNQTLNQTNVSAQFNV